MDEIVLNGKRYRLVPIEDDAVEAYIGAVAQRSEQRPVEAKTEGSSPSSSAVAVPKHSDYRERYKKHQLSLTELKVPPKILSKLSNQDGELDRYNYKGENLFFGEGVQQEF